MPTYGYECKNCGHGFEAFQKITDDSLTTCELCGGELKKKIFPVGIVFKGSGFYVNDYANKSASPKEESPLAAADAPKAQSDSAPPAAADTAVKSAETTPPATTPAPAAPSTTSATTS